MDANPTHIHTTLQEKKIDLTMGMGQSLTTTFMSDLEKLSLKKSTHRISNIIVTTLLSLLLSLPLHLSSTHWVPKVRSILLCLLHSSSSKHRRGAAEGIGLLVTKLRGEGSGNGRETIVMLENVSTGKGVGGKGKGSKGESLRETGKLGGVLALGCIGRCESENAGGEEIDKNMNTGIGEDSNSNTNSNSNSNSNSNGNRNSNSNSNR